LAFAATHTPAKRGNPPIHINRENILTYRVQNNILFFKLPPTCHKLLVPQKNSIRNLCGKLAETGNPAEKICIIGQIQVF